MADVVKSGKKIKGMNSDLIGESDASPPIIKVIKRPSILESDKKMMELAVSDAGTWCYGVKAIDVWIVHPTDGRLVACRGGRWVDPVYFQNKDPKIHSALMRIYDSNFPDYLDPMDLSVASGEGLAGALWADTSGTNFIPGMGTILTEENINKKRVRKKIKWRDVQGMADDPDQPYNKRIKVIADAGFHLAAGVPFNIRNKTRGLVVYMTRKSVDQNKLNSFLNEEYMLTAAQHIGSVLALRTPRQLALKERINESNNAFQRAKSELQALSRRNSSLAESLAESLHDDGDVKHDMMEDTHHVQLPTKSEKISELIDDTLSQIKIYSLSWFEKMRGSNVQPPPGMNLSEVLFAMCAAFLTVFIMSMINQSVKGLFGRNLGFELGQIGGISTLVFTLSAAPGAQPRSIIMAQSICMLVGMTFAHIPTSGIDSFDSPLEWFRVSASVAVACAIMARLGIVHPPGGGLAVIFLRYKLNERMGFEKMGVLLLQDVLFIILAAAITNTNTNPARRYPTYWGHIPNKLSRLVRNVLSIRSHENKDH